MDVRLSGLPRSAALSIIVCNKGGVMADLYVGDCTAAKEMGSEGRDEDGCFH